MGDLKYQGSGGRKKGDGWNAENGKGRKKQRAEGGRLEKDRVRGSKSRRLRRLNARRDVKDREKEREEMLTRRK